MKGSGIEFVLCKIPHSVVNGSSKKGLAEPGLWNVYQGEEAIYKALRKLKGEEFDYINPPGKRGGQDTKSEVSVRQGASQANTRPGAGLGKGVGGTTTIFTTVLLRWH